MSEGIDYVRVKDPDSGHEFTTSSTNAEHSGLKVLDKPAVDEIGRPLPAKYNVGPTPGQSSTQRGRKGAPVGSQPATPEEEN